MKTTLVLLSSAVLLVGCGDSGNKTPDQGVPVSDAGVKVDAAGPSPDLKANVECTKVGAWPALMPSGFFDPNYEMSPPGATVGVTRQTAGSPWNELSVESWHMAKYPTTVTYKVGDTYSACDTCVIYSENCDDTGCENFYLAQGGTATVTAADSVVSMGKLKATATSLKLVQWDFQNDAPMDDTICVEIDSAAWDVSWTGIDGGTTD